MVETSGRPSSTEPNVTLDDLWRRAAARRPNAVALIDPPNRADFTDGNPRQLTYAQADRIISLIADRLHQIGLPSGAIVGLQLANVVEGALILLAVLRAGMTAMPLPLLWRRADAVAALNLVGINALIVSGRIGKCNHYDLALRIAAEVFPIRSVCGIGPAPDGIVSLDDLVVCDGCDGARTPPDREHALGGDYGSQAAVVTWDVSLGGPVPVGRTQEELLAGGTAVLLESGISRDAVILATLTMSSFAGLASQLVPWLLTGGTLVLHQPFDPAVFQAQLRSSHPTVVVLPGPAATLLAEAGCLAPHSASVLGIWRAPDRLARAAAWRQSRFVDVQVFGEVGLIATLRGADGLPVANPFGSLLAARSVNGGIVVAEIRPTLEGTLAMRGPMVPHTAFPAGVERTTIPQVRIHPDGFVDTGYPCWSDGRGQATIVTGVPRGIVGVGGYRFPMRDLLEVTTTVDPTATLAALPDGLIGHRLAGSTRDRVQMEQSLTERGCNPLLAGAFADQAAAAPPP